jgi:hypothetical protein
MCVHQQGRGREAVGRSVPPSWVWGCMFQMCVLPFIFPKPPDIHGSGTCCEPLERAVTAVCALVGWVLGLARVRTVKTVRAGHVTAKTVGTVEKIQVALVWRSCYAHEMVRSLHNERVGCVEFRTRQVSKVSALHHFTPSR